MDDVQIIEEAVDYLTFFDDFRYDIELAVVKISDDDASSYFEDAGRSIYRHDGIYTKAYIKKCDNLKQKYFDSVFGQQASFICFLRLTYVVLKKSDVTPDFLYNSISEYLKHGFEKCFKNVATMTLDEAILIRQIIKDDIIGCYVIHNITRGKYYAGQSMSVFNRISQHVRGCGCKDICVDYRSHNVFTVLVFPFDDSGYDSLDAMERDLIYKYQAYDFGYNKTSGNSDNEFFDGYEGNWFL